jgi:hypothetical protein
LYNPDFKIDIDEYIAYFLQDKNEFISEFSKYVESNKEMSLLMRKNCMNVLEILKSGIDEILKDYKNLKQKMLRKMKKKDNFYKLKEEYYSHFNINVNTKSSLMPSIPNIPNALISKPTSNVLIAHKPKTINYLDMINQEPNINQEIYKENPQVIHIFRENESKNLEKTKQTLYELSDLMTNFSSKVSQHHEITQNSKLYFHNSNSGVTNVSGKHTAWKQSAS